MQPTSLATFASVVTIAMASAAPAMAQPPSRYRGILPCADCSALRIELALFAGKTRASGTYRETLTYVATRDGDRAFSSRGKWKAEHGAQQRIVYRLRDAKSGEATVFAADGDRSLRLLDSEEHEIAAPLPHVLWRAERRFTGAPIVIDEETAPHAVAMRPGQELVVRLRANPTTGYRWTMASDAAGALALSASPSFRRDSVPKGMVGVGGVETWRMLAARPGDGALTFEYRRPWEKDAKPARVATFDVKVRDAPAD